MVIIFHKARVYIRVFVSELSRDSLSLVFRRLVADLQFFQRILDRDEEIEV